MKATISYVSLVVFFVLTFQLSLAYAQANQGALKSYVSFLASDGMNGRKSGSAEADSVADFLVSKFTEYNLTPLHNSYKQNFTYSRSASYIAPIKATNIIGMLEGSDASLKDEFIVIGAHYDHIGIKTTYTGSYNQFICNGADDNASGVAVMLELARLISHNKVAFKRSILFVAFSAEEDGLIGSQYFIANSPVGLDSIKLMLNLDMLGMLSFNKSLLIKGLPSVEGAGKVARTISKKYPFKIVAKQSDIFWCTSSDHAPFYNKNIGSIFFTTGLHPYYHTADDDVERIDFEGLKNITNYVYNFALQLSCFRQLKFKTVKKTELFDGDKYLIIRP